MTQPQIEVYKKYFDQLVKCLPMDDALFTAALSKHNLLPSNTNNKIEALLTAADKASCFLNIVIKPALDISDTSSFDNLLSIMEHCGFDHVEKLACTIKSDIDETSSTEQGSYNVLICWYIPMCIAYIVI